MNPATISALAALGGSSVGAMTPIVSNYVMQRSATRRDIFSREIAQRQVLYSDFISEGARLHAEALTHSTFELSDAVALYALVSRIRLVAPEPVVQAAEDVVRTIIERYGDRNLNLEDLRAIALASKADPLRVFSTACRQDLRTLLHWRG